MIDNHRFYIFILNLIEIYLKVYQTNEIIIIINILVGVFEMVRVEWGFCRRLGSAREEWFKGIICK